MKRTGLLAAAIAVIALAGAADAQRIALAARPIHGPQRLANPVFAGPGFRNGFACGRFMRGGAPANRNRFRRGFGDFSSRFLGYGAVDGVGDGYALDDPYAVAHDSGFFFGEGDVHVSGGRAVYDYDRSYPYDWYRDRAQRPMPRRLTMREPMPAAIHCDVEGSVRVCRGGE